MKKWILKFAFWKTPNDIFEAVKSSRKTIETRPLNPKSTKNYAHMKSEDQVEIVSLDTKERLIKTVDFIHTYRSVSRMADQEDIGKILPGVKSKEELLEAFDEFKKKWGKDYAFKLDNYGIVAIGLK